MDTREIILFISFFRLIHPFYSLSGVSTLYTLLWLSSLYRQQYIRCNNLWHNGSDSDQQVEYGTVYMDDDINIVEYVKLE